VPRHRTVTRVALTQKITVPLLHPRHVKCKLILGPEINRIISDLQQGHGFGGFPLGVCEVICQCDGRDHRVEIWLSYQRRTARRPGETIPHHTTPHHTSPSGAGQRHSRAINADTKNHQMGPVHHSPPASFPMTMIHSEALFLARSSMKLRLDKAHHSLR
jgi:hypothetical protein